MTNKPSIEETRLKGVNVEEEKDIDIVDELLMKETDPFICLLYRKLFQAMEAISYQKDIIKQKDADVEEYASRLAESEEDCYTHEREIDFLNDEISNLLDQIEELKREIDYATE